MTNNVAIHEEAINLSNLESLAEEMFTRPRTSETNLKILKAVAAEVFYGKRIRTSLMEREITQLRETMELVALILGKTYVGRGDSYSLADDEALTLISDLIIAYDPSIIARNKSKRIPKHLLR